MVYNLNKHSVIIKEAIMYYTITTTLPKVHGGRTKSLLKRVHLLSKKLRVNNIIITTNYNADYPSIYDFFRKSNIVPKKQEFDNIYDWLSGYKLHAMLKDKDIIETNYFIDGVVEEILPKGVVRYYNREGEYVLYRKYYKNTKILKFEDFMSPLSKKKIERWEYNEYGILHKKITYSIKNYNKINEEYYDLNGNIYCSKIFDEETKKLSVIKVLKNNRVFKAFKTEKSFINYYLQNKLKDQDIVFCDARYLDMPLLDVNKDIERIMVYHSAHYFFEDDKNRNSYKASLSNQELISKYIVLTDEQKMDIIQSFGIDEKKIDVIPHFTKKEKCKKTKAKRSKNKRFCYVGRFDENKQIDHIIKAFKIVADKRDHVNLDLYGLDEGNLKDKLRELIIKNNLQDKVNIYDFVDNPNEVFQKSLASILTSKFEGFGMTVMESLNNNCSVIAYDIKYGPSEMIDHGVNGYLVEKNNIKSLATYMTKMIDSPLKKVCLPKRYYKKATMKKYNNLLRALKHK